MASPLRQRGIMAYKFAYYIKHLIFTPGLQKPLTSTCFIYSDYDAAVGALSIAVCGSNELPHPGTGKSVFPLNTNWFQFGLVWNFLSYNVMEETFFF